MRFARAAETWTWTIVESSTPKCDVSGCTSGTLRASSCLSASQPAAAAGQPLSSAHPVLHPLSVCRRHPSSVALATTQGTASALPGESMACRLPFNLLGRGSSSLSGQSNCRGFHFTLQGQEISLTGLSATVPCSPQGTWSNETRTFSCQSW